jgi:hypothetical protein
MDDGRDRVAKLAKASGEQPHPRLQYAGRVATFGRGFLHKTRTELASYAVTWGLRPNRRQFCRKRLRDAFVDNGFPPQPARPGIRRLCFSVDTK